MNADEYYKCTIKSILEDLEKSKGEVDLDQVFMEIRLNDEVMKNYLSDKNLTIQSDGIVQNILNWSLD